MNIINQWSTLICLSSIACVIIEFMLPSGKMEKMLRMVLGVFILSCLVIPFSNGIPRFKLKIDSDLIKSKEEYKFLEFADNQFQMFAVDNLKVIIGGVLKDIGIKEEKIEIFMDTKRDNCISITKCRIFIKKLNEKEIGSIKRELKEKLNMEAEVIVN